jgi:Tfp pilus tip-associated adhesin PilY1
MKHAFKKLLLALGLAAFCASPFAVFDPVNDDTDLFRNNPNIPAERPNVLIILDNSANWSSGTKFANEKTALVNTVAALDDSYNVGLMIFTQGGSCQTSNIDGGYVRFGIRQMTPTNKAALTTIVTGFADAACGPGGDQGSAAVGGQSMHEAYLYFGGKTSRSGITQTKRDYAGSTVNTVTASLPGNPFSSITAATYTSPVTDACAKNYIIYISNGPFDNGDDSPSSALYAGSGGLVPNASSITLSPSGSQSNWSDEYATYLANTGVNNVIGGVTSNQKVFTYSVEVDPGTTGQGPGHTALMKSMASGGKGKYFGVTSASSGVAISDALLSIFTEIQAVNSVFAASTLPVSVNVRGTNLNQLYIGVFRPDSADRPRWLGNLKAYQLKRDSVTNTVFTADALLNPAINSSTGFITSNAKSFWTDPNLPNSTYWSFRSASANGVGGSSDSPDGDLVEKGGAAQQLRARYFTAGVNGVSPDPSRLLYTCTQGTPLCDTHPATNALPSELSLLSATPFTVANVDIDAGSLNIDTRQVSPLTAAISKPITALVDSRPVTLNNASGATKTVSSITTNTTVLNASSISNTRTVSVTSMSNGAVAKTLSSIVVANGANKVATATSTAHGIGSTQTVIISGTTNFNGSRLLTGATANTFTFGSFTGTINESSGTATTSNLTVNVIANSHGFSNNQSVTIAGAVQASFNGAKTITFTNANEFSYANSVEVAPTGTITATGATTTVTVNFAAAHGLLAGQSVVIAGANPTGYNGTYTIQTVPSATSLTYTTASAVATANTGTVTVTTSGTTATATSTAHGLAGTVTISGASPAGFNGTFAIFNVTADTFDYTAAAGLGTATADPTIQASTALGGTVTATRVNHRFSNGMSITIAGAADATHNGAFDVDSVVDNDTFTYIYKTLAPFAAPGGTPTVRRTSSPRAYATMPAHGFGAANTTISPFTVAGAVPAGYNGTYTNARVEDADTMRYTLTSAIGAANTGSPVTASTNSTTAVATSTAHGFTPGVSVVTIGGASPSAFNGSFTVATTPSADTFTYTIGSAQGAATGAITAISSGAGASERTNVINWVRGEDNFEDENANSSFSDTRASMHGDVLHSRPSVVNYNRRGTADPANADNDVYIFYGGNDGVFRATKGGFASTVGDPAPGQEVWGFIAKDHFGTLKRLRLNSPAISSNFKKPYFFDGPIGAYTLDANGDGMLDPDNQLVAGVISPASTGDKVWLFLTMRRGGRAIYALDVSRPDAPRLLWRRGCPSYSADTAQIDSATGCDLGFSELGQTWSEPKIVSITCSTTPCGSTDPVLIFGAGYDPLVEDPDPATVSCITSASLRVGASGCSGGTVLTRSMGRGLFVVNARTGGLIWHASPKAPGAVSMPTGATYKQIVGMDYAIASDIAVVVGDPSTKPFRAYVGDMGGQMWRFDFGDLSGSAAMSNPANWTVVKLGSIADLTTTVTSGGVTWIPGQRKFQFAPDVVGSSGFDMVIAGSGDREHPFDAKIVNRVYGFKDKRQTSATVDGGGAQIQPAITHATSVTFNGSSVKSLLDVSTQCIEIPGACSGTAPEIVVGGTSASLNTSNALVDTTNTGWFITLAAGEKQVGSTLASGSGVVQFGTNQPSASAGGGACSPNLGVARQYTINYLDGTAYNGTALSTTYVGGGFLPSPVLVFVGLGGASGTGSTSGTGVGVGGTISGGTIKIGAGASTGGSDNVASAVVCYGASCTLAPGSVLFSRLRKFWYKEID